LCVANLELARVVEHASEHPLGVRRVDHGVHVAVVRYPLASVAMAVPPKGGACAFSVVRRRLSRGGEPSHQVRPKDEVVGEVVRHGEKTIRSAAWG
jgi:hypothetical protein